MQEVDALSVDARPVVLEAVERGLGGTPVVLVAPIGDPLVHVPDLRAVVPVGSLDLVGPARRREPPLQVLEQVVAQPDLESLDRVARGILRRAFIHTAGSGGKLGAPRGHPSPGRGDCGGPAPTAARPDRPRAQPGGAVAKIRAAPGLACRTRKRPKPRPLRVLRRASVAP